MTWVLILLFQSSVGPAGAALTNVPGFASRKACEDAGRATAEKIGGGHQVRWSCVSQGGAEPAAKP
jgi:hypothetical protein